MDYYRVIPWIKIHDKIPESGKIVRQVVFYEQRQTYSNRQGNIRRWVGGRTFEFGSEIDIEIVIRKSVGTFVQEFFQNRKQ